MTFDPTKPVQTRDGHKARILCTDLKHPIYKIAAAITESKGMEDMYGFCADGAYTPGHKSHFDLINIEPSKFIHVTAP